MRIKLILILAAFAVWPSVTMAETSIRNDAVVVGADPVLVDVLANDSSSSGRPLSVTNFTTSKDGVSISDISSTGGLLRVVVASTNDTYGYTNIPLTVSDGTNSFSSTLTICWDLDGSDGVNSPFSAACGDLANEVPPLCDPYESCTPHSLVASVSSESPLRIYLQWQNEAGYREGNRIYRRIAGNNSWSNVGQVDETVTSFIDVEAGYAEDYEYSVRAISGVEVTPSSNIARIQTPTDPSRPPSWVMRKDQVDTGEEVNGGGTYEYSYIRSGAFGGKRQFSIDNVSTDLELSISVQIEGTDWQLVESPKTLLVPGQRTIFYFGLTDTGPVGSRQGTVTILTNDPAKPSVRFTLLQEVLPPPDKIEIVEQPRYGGSKLIGESVSFSVVASGGSGEYNYQWHSSYDSCFRPDAPCPIEPDDPLFSGQNSKVLTIPIITDDQRLQAEYSVFVTDKQDPDTVPLKSGSAGFSILEGKIVSGPPPTMARQGETVAFHLSTEGLEPSGFDWFGPEEPVVGYAGANGVLLVDDDIYSGASTPTLTIRTDEFDLSEYVAYRFSSRIHWPLGPWSDWYDMYLKVVGSNIDLGHIFGTGTHHNPETQYRPLHGAPVQVASAGTHWKAEAQIVMKEWYLLGRGIIDASARASAELPHSVRLDEVDVRSRLAIMTSEGGIELGIIKHLDEGFFGAVRGLSARMTSSEVQLLAHGTDILATAPHACAPRAYCELRLLVEPLMQRASIYVNEEQILTQTIERNLVRGADHVLLEFFTLDGTGGDSGHEVVEITVDLSRRTDVVPWLTYILL